MAISKNFETQHGITIQNAYVRVESINATKQQMTFSVSFYANKEKPFFEAKVFSCAYEILGENPIKQAYEHLKTLPEFAGAIDC